MAPSKKVELQKPCCPLEQMEYREERRQLGDVLLIDEGVRSGQGGDATSPPFCRCRRHLHGDLGGDVTSGSV